MPFQPYLAYEASAGSGKTFALVVRYISLLFLDANPSKILTLTFTNKSAKEMSDRIKNTLYDLKNKPAELEQLSFILNISKEDILRQTPEIFKKFLRSDIKIATIDSFVTSILRGFAFHFALLNNFEISLSKDPLFLKQFLKHLKNIQEYDSLISYLVFKNQKVEDTIKIFEEFYSRDFEISALNVQVDTTKNYEQNIKNSFGRIKEFFFDCPKASNAAKNLFKPYDKPEELLKRTWLEKSSLKEHNYLKKCYEENIDIFFIDLKENLKQYLIQKEKIILSKLFEFYKEYKELNLDSKRALNELSFNDISNLVYEVLNEIDKEFLYFRLDARIEHLLIDEFQDTSLLQYAILEPIIEEITAGIGTSDTVKSFFYVGDVKQSIYRFRGGNKKLFSHVAKKHNMVLDILGTNYRSSKNVIEYVNKIFISKISNYTAQLVPSFANKGYIDITSSDAILETMYTKVNMFIEAGVDVNDIAILCFTNSDAYTIKTALKNIPSVTSSNAKLIKDRVIKAIINYIKYLYYKEDIFKYNFLSLIGKELEDDLKIISLKQSFMKLLINIIEEFNLFYQGSEIFKFIDECTKYIDLDDFIDKIDLLDANISPKNLDGVKILTIHKSKGLEFENLIVLDRLTKKMSNSSFVYRYEDMKLKEILLNFANRSSIDDHYKNTLLKEKENIQEDELNTLYVGFTRAKNSLCVVKHAKKSAYDVLGLDDVIYGDIYPSLVKIEQTKLQKIAFEEFKAGKQNIVKNTEITDNKNLSAIYFGTAVHYMLEGIHGFKPEYIQDSYLCTTNRYAHLLSKAQLKDLKTRVVNLLDNPEFQELVTGKINKEQPVKYDDKIYHIDLMIETDDSIKIIDYKTSSFLEEKYLKQLNLYKEAVKLTSDKNIECYICYLFKNNIEIKRL